jgi:hypothetical protein
LWFSQHHVVALAQRPVRGDQEARDQEQRDAVHPRRAIGDLGQHQVHDVLDQLVVPARDPHLGAEQPEAAVGLRLGPGADVGQRRTGSGLGQAHRAGEAAGEHRLHERPHLLRRTVREQQVRVRDGEERVGRGADVGRLEPQEARLRDDLRELQAADGLIHRGADDAGLGEHAQRGADLVDDMHPLPVEPGFLLVGGPVVRCEVTRRHLLGQLQHRVEGVPRVLGEPRPAGQRFDVQPLVEQEVQIPAGQQQRGHAGHRVLTPCAAASISASAASLTRSAPRS